MVLKSRRLLVGLLLAADGCGLVAQEVTYSFADAKSRMLHASDALKVADVGVQIARKEQGRAAAWWWPLIRQAIGFGFY